MSTENHIGEQTKILLYAGNFCISNPLSNIKIKISRVGKIYFKYQPEQSAGNFSFSHKAREVNNSTYNSYKNLPVITELAPKPNKLISCKDTDFGNFLAGLIEGDGWFGKNALHINFAENDLSLAYLIKEKLGMVTYTK